MKTVFKLPFKLIFTLLAFTLIGSGFIVSDACKAYYPMEKGKKFELTYYSGKDKVQGRTGYEIIEKSESGNSLSATVHMTSYDKKDEQILESDFTVKCENGIFEIDIRGILSGAQMQQMSSMEGMDVSVASVNLELPSTMKVGDQLKDGQLEMKLNASEGGMTLVSFNTYITNRKVEARETVTTPAGSFDCLVISSEVQSKSGFIKMNYTNKEWISENVGVVKSETYKKGSLEGYSQLTKFE